MLSFYKSDMGTKDKSGKQVCFYAPVKESDESELNQVLVRAGV